MDDAVSSNKRCRYDLDESPEAKRLRADFFLDILDDDETDSGDRDPAAQDIATVMRSLEEEIGLPLTSLPPATEELLSDRCQPDLGYLLEASDDELGLPPAAVTPSSSTDDVVEVQPLDGEPEAAGFGQIWGFYDEIPGCYGGGMGFDIPPEDGSLVFNGGIFDYSDVLYGPSDYSDFSWRPESLPAI